jgi:ADP-ribose pyrophosphatase YjhB (NUDIX family)
VDGPSALDAGIRGVYRVAHRVLRTWWFVRRPRTHGALVALWHDGALLLVKNSYRREHTLPGGYVARGETPEEAARRELLEETGLDLPASRFRQAFEGELPFEFRRDFLTIVEVELEARPEIRVDNREVVWAGWKRPEEILRMNVVPHVVDYLRTRAAALSR